MSYSRIETEDTTSELTIGLMLLRRRWNTGSQNSITQFYLISSSVTAQYNVDENNHTHYIAKSSELGMGFKLDDKILQYLLLAASPAQTMFNVLNGVMPVASFRYQ